MSGSKAAAASRVLGVIACVIVVIAVSLTALSFAIDSQGLQMMTALIVVPFALVIAGLIGLVGLVLAIVSGVRARSFARNGSCSGVHAGSARPRLVPAVVLNLVGGLGLPIAVGVLFLATGG